MSRLPTIRIKSGDGFATINASDFVKGKHEVYVEGAAQFDPGMLAVLVADQQSPVEIEAEPIPEPPKSGSKKSRR